MSPGNGPWELGHVPATPCCLRCWSASLAAAQAPSASGAARPSHHTPLGLRLVSLVIPAQGFSLGVTALGCCEDHTPGVPPPGQHFFPLTVYS